MKKFITLLTVSAVVMFSSCSKEELPTPTNPTPASGTNHVEYRVTSVTGHVNVTYKTYENGSAETHTVAVDRTVINYEMDVPANSSLSVKASNQLPMAQEVHVEIYVNGTLVKEGFANAPAAVAVAEIVK